LAIGDLVSREDEIRLLIFISVFVVMVVWEVLARRRETSTFRVQRWSTNFAMLVLGIASIRAVLPMSLIQLADWIGDREWGAVAALDLPFMVGVAVSVIALDFCLYGQHLLMHRVSWLWRLHQVHHADPEFDVTTGLRFHPFEIAVSTLYKALAVVVLGPPALAVLIFEIALNSSSMFTHANGRLPQRLDRLIRWLFVTPDMHRIHHSVVVGELNTNFGFNLAIWDKLFGTYRQEAALECAHIEIGLRLQPGRASSLGPALRIPFDKRTTSSS
jgi:sterol desaturase/sphingolipid hydroxylase (fatty acid hydroxylase superfamily)